MFDYLLQKDVWLLGGQFTERTSYRKMRKGGLASKPLAPLTQQIPPTTVPGGGGGGGSEKVLHFITIPWLEMARELFQSHTAPFTSLTCGKTVSSSIREDNFMLLFLHMCCNNVNGLNYPTKQEGKNMAVLFVWSVVVCI